MNTITASDRKLAAMLKSLSIEPAPGAPLLGKPPHRRWRLPVAIGLSVALGAIGAAAALTVLPDRSRILHQIAGSITPEARPVVAPEARPVVAAPSALLPVPAGREITGSGLVVAPGSTAVFARYEGRITAIEVALGDRVEAGDVLLTLDDPTARFALAQAHASRKAAELVVAGRRIELSQARTSLDRTEVLAAREAVSQKLLDEARTTFAAAENALAQAEQGVAQAELAIRIAEEPVAALTIRAPFAGTITRRSANVGDTVLARADSVREDQSLLTIADTAHLVIDADVAETAIAALSPGLKGEAVLDGYPDAPFGVEVLRLAPVVSAEKGTITLRLALTDPPTGIRPNMAARIRLTLPPPGTEEPGTPNGETIE